MTIKANANELKRNKFSLTNIEDSGEKQGVWRSQVLKNLNTFDLVFLHSKIFSGFSTAGVIFLNFGMIFSYSLRRIQVNFLPPNFLN